MKISSQQITSRGIAQQSGLDTLSSIINYTGEYINYTTGLDPSLAIASAYSTTADDPFVDSLLNNPPSVINAWYKFYTGGSPWATTTTPLSVSGLFIFNGNNTELLQSSYSGIYQKLSLIQGDNYNIYIDRFGITPSASTTGVIKVEIYTPQDESYVKIFENQVRVPMGAADSQTFDAGEFTASSANDIVQYNGSAWTVVFDASAKTSTTALATNSHTSQQFKWTGAQWISSWQGTYNPGYWRLIL